MNIICVDDDETIRNKVVCDYKNICNDIYSFPNGDDALAFLDFHQKKIDFAVLDVQMEEMSGIRLCSILQERFPEVETIFLTNFPELIEVGPSCDPFHILRKTEFSKNRQRLETIFKKKSLPNILIIDDRLQTIKQIRKKLKGANVFYCIRPDDALLRAMRRKYKVVFIDVDLKNEINGISLCENLISKGFFNICLYSNCDYEFLYEQFPLQSFENTYNIFCIKGNEINSTMIEWGIK